MATIQDVAKHAQVGVGTVSRVLSGKGYVKEETRRKVQASIKALDYTPNAMARSLLLQKSGVVAVIVPEASHPFFAQFVSAAEAFLCEKGYQTMICNTYYTENYEQRYLDMLKQKRVDGIIFGAHVSLDILQYEAIKRPIVAFDRDMGKNIPCVSVNHKEGGRMAAGELLRSGCKNVFQFCGIKGEENVSTPSAIRHKIFAEIMEEHGVACQSRYIKWHSSDVDYYQRMANEFLEEHPEVDGVFATDMIIMAILQSALAKKKKIPEELRLVAYDGTHGIGLTFPQVTTVVQPIDRLAQEAVRLIVDLIDEKPIADKKVELQVTLRSGDTTMRG